MPNAPAGRANGYVMKAEAAVTVMGAIRSVLSGKIYISEKINDLLLHQVQTLRKNPRTCESLVERLSDRELQIFRLLGDGVRVREIAASFISV